MNPYLLSLSLVCAALTSCAHRNAWHTPVEESVSTSPSDAGAYPMAGHLSTTGIAARCAGLDGVTSERLAYFSQAPDDIFMAYNAVPVAVWGKLLPPAWGYHQRIMKTLHSLHGGDTEAVKVRRQKLAAMIKGMTKTEKTEQWKIGFLIHAMGDSYAHVHGPDGGKVAYGPFVGHGFDHSEFPDHISKHLDTYIEYTTTLSEALGGPKGGSDRLKVFIGALKEIPLNGSLDENEAAVQECIRDFGKSLADTTGSQVAVSRKECYKEISFSKANAFLKQATKDLK